MARYTNGSLLVVRCKYQTRLCIESVMIFLKCLTEKPGVRLTLFVFAVLRMFILHWHLFPISLQIRGSVAEVDKVDAHRAATQHENGVFGTCSGASIRKEGHTLSRGFGMDGIRRLDKKVKISMIDPPYHHL